MINITCVWGDNIDLPDEFDVNELQKYLSEYRDWSPYQVEIVVYPEPSVNEKEYVAYAVDRKHCVQLPSTLPPTEMNMGKMWLKTCDHPTILKLFLKQNDLFSPVYANPDPLIVDEILNTHITPVYMSANPADPIIDWLEQHPELIDWTQLCRNPNPRVSTLIIDALRREDSRLLLADATAVEHGEVCKVLYEMFKAKLVGLRPWRMNTSPFAIDILIQLFDCIPSNRVDDVLRTFAKSHYLPAILHYLSYHQRKGCRIHDELWTNTHERAVDYCLSQPRIPHFLFCCNSNDLAVHFYETHPELIVWPEYLSNNNPLSVERGIEWLKHNTHTPRVINELSKNTHPDMVLFAVNHIAHLSLSIKVEMVANCSEIIHVLET